MSSNKKDVAPINSSSTLSDTAKFSRSYPLDSAPCCERGFFDISDQKIRRMACTAFKNQLQRIYPSAGLHQFRVDAHPRYSMLMVVVDFIPENDFSVDKALEIANRRVDKWDREALSELLKAGYPASLLT